MCSVATPSHCAAIYGSGGQDDINFTTDGTCPTRWSPTHANISVIDNGNARIEAIARRANAADRWRPDDIKLLLVAQTPPLAPDRYFYFDDVATHDGLFRYVSKGVLGQTPPREGKRAALSAPRDRGVFLLDLKPDPFDARPLNSFVESLIDRCRQTDPNAIVLIKSDVYDAAYTPLSAAGLPVVDIRIPFPGSGQQRRFECAFAKALDAVDSMSSHQIA